MSNSANIPRPAASSMVDRLIAVHGRAIIGMDVGEDCLYLAAVAPSSGRVRFRQVRVAGIETAGTDAIGELRRRIVDAMSGIGLKGAIALVDSPRWPSDLDWSKGGDAPKKECHPDHPKGRIIDGRLRELVRRLKAPPPKWPALGLSMFPTPPFRFFEACVNGKRCPPHLARVGQELFGVRGDAAGGMTEPGGGRLFTRFMLTGFAAYRALEMAGVVAFESYPDLVFRLWTREATLAPKKKSRSSALKARIMIDCRIADEAGLAPPCEITRLDEADAAALALSAAAAGQNDVGVIGVIEVSCEGRFAIPLRLEQARAAGIKAEIADKK